MQVNHSFLSVTNICQLVVILLTWHVSNSFVHYQRF